MKKYLARRPVWIIPMIYVGVPIAAGFALPRFEQAYLASFTHSISVASAQAVLSSIASGMMSVSAVSDSTSGLEWMGLEPFPEVPVTELTLESGDRLLLHTDGVSELFNEAGEPYGEKRLLRQIEAGDTDDPELIRRGIVNNLAGFAGSRPADDDQAMIMIVAE